MKHYFRSLAITCGTATRFSAQVGLAAACLGLSGCLLTSPFWNQQFASHTAQVPLQAWTTDAAVTAIKFECSQAYHGGTYPPFDSPTWTLINNVAPSAKPNLDPEATAIYSAALKTALPSACWRKDPGNNTWYAAIRATHTSSDGTTSYNTFDATGLACLGAEIGAARSWLGWIGKDCVKTYSGSTTAVPFVIIRAPA